MLHQFALPPSSIRMFLFPHSLDSTGCSQTFGPLSILQGASGISVCFLFFYFIFFFYSVSVETVKNCQCRLYFKSSWRGIGKSFQLAIIAPRINLIGYDTATAQSWRTWARTHFPHGWQLPFHWGWPTASELVDWICFPAYSFTFKVHPRGGLLVVGPSLVEQYYFGNKKALSLGILGNIMQTSVTSQRRIGLACTLRRKQHQKNRKSEDKPKNQELEVRVWGSEKNIFKNPN